MHTAIVHLTPILGAEKSKTPFYIAGGVLVAWALFVSLGLGLRVSGFPGSAAAERVVMAVTALLVLGAISAAVATSGGSTKAEASSAPASAPASNGGVSPGAGGPSVPLTQAADPSGQLRFLKPSLAATAGKVSIEFANRSPLAHNLTVARGKTVLGATPTFSGGSKTLTLTLKPGAYKFFCSVPGHREAGMEGTLFVR
jgi:plastocyanin